MSVCVLCGLVQGPPRSLARKFQIEQRRERSAVAALSVKPPNDGGVRWKASNEVPPRENGET